MQVYSKNGHRTTEHSRELSRELRAEWREIVEESGKRKKQRVVIDLRFLEEFGTDAGLLLSFLTFWTGKGHDPDGWIYVTAEEIRDRVKIMTRRRIDAARRTLKEGNVLEEKLKSRRGKRADELGVERWTRVGNPAKVIHYRVDLIELSLRLGIMKKAPPGSEVDFVYVREEGEE